jgi:hypothetical protein
MTSQNSKTSNRWLQPRRVTVIAMHTFTQLVRMKVFYFLSVFALIVIAANFLDLPQFNGPEAIGVGELQMLKSTCMGVMKLFAVVFVIAATALLLPKDVEDRTLYTILAKPVPRLDYLVGKIAGVLLLVFVSLLLMDLLMTVVLSFRTNHLLVDQLSWAEARGWTQEAIDSERRDIIAQGPTWSFQGAVFAIFLQSAIIGAVALLLSTFSTSTLFTIILSFLIYLIGHFQADAADYYKATAEAGSNAFTTTMTKLLSLIFPNFQLFNVIDAVIEGIPMTMNAIISLTGLSLFYVVLYTMLSWFVFSDKEF